MLALMLANQVNKRVKEGRRFSLFKAGGDREVCKQVWNGMDGNCSTFFLPNNQRQQQ